MKKAFLVIMMLAIPILSFGADPQASNTGTTAQTPPSTVLEIIKILVTPVVIAFLAFYLNKKLERFRWELRVREQAAKVPELLAEARDGVLEVTPERARKLNKMIWELALWLPAELVRGITDTLNKSGNPDWDKILIDVRKYILEPPKKRPKDDLESGQIQWFKPTS